MLVGTAPGTPRGRPRRGQRFPPSGGPRPMASAVAKRCFLLGEPLGPATTHIDNQIDSAAHPAGCLVASSATGRRPCRPSITTTVPCRDRLDAADAAAADRPARSFKVLAVALCRLGKRARSSPDCSAESRVARARLASAKLHSKDIAIAASSSRREDQFGISAAPQAIEINWAAGVWPVAAYLIQGVAHDSQFARDRDNHAAAPSGGRDPAPGRR